MQNILFGIYVGAVIVALIIYLFVIFRICRSENISVSEAFGFNKKEKTYRSEPKQQSQESYSVSVDEQINNLYEQLSHTEGEERVAIWRHIQELKKQK